MCTPTNTFNRGKEDFTNDLEKSTKEADTKTFEIPAHSRQYSKLADARTALVGLEPTNLGVKVPCLAAWLHPIIFKQNSGVSSGARTHDLQGHNLAL